jgi:HlyD family secretion protein
MKRFIKRSVLIILPLVVLALVLLWYFYRDGEQTGLFRTEEVIRGDLTATISATGVVQPEEVVNVGAQVAGQILSFGTDRFGKTIDYGSVVEEGTVLALIDDSLYSADVAQAKAQLDQAKAGVLRAEADLGQLQAKRLQADRDWNRAKKLGPSDALSQSDYDAALSAYDVAEANEAVGKTAIIQAKDAVSQAEAVLRRSQRNLDYCTIKSPVKGVIIDRRVNIGQTVVASLNAPSLFLIAKDLKRLEVWVAVNEADIGNIHPNQEVTFSVDAFPGQIFLGKVGKVRLNATMTQNVVTYTVEVITDNSNGKLLPYLTANAKFLLSKRENVLLVPNAALRWTPQPEQVVSQEQAEKPPVGSGNERTSRSRTASESSQQDGSGGVVWVPRGAHVEQVHVSIGLSDGMDTEVQSDKLKEGDQVVVGEQVKEKTNVSTTASPFTPQIPRGSRPSR